VLKKSIKSARYYVLGREYNEGLVFKIFLYAIFISTAYIYMNPMLYMLTTMIKSLSDLLDPTVVWIPTSFFIDHLEYAYSSLNYTKSFSMSLAVSLLSAISHCFSCAIAGYAFARLQFPLKKLMFGCLLLALIMPSQVIILPTILAYNQLGFSNSLFSLIIPSLFGHGIRGALFIIIFRQFFLTQPKELEEAARVDGANVFRIFFRVVFPLAKPAILVVFLFSFVWTWNDTTLPNMFMTGAKDVPLAAQMFRLDSSISGLVERGAAPAIFFEPIKMAASFLVILPPLLLYVFAQKWFVESVERTGLIE
jgi:multiple sugar transport system permease protein